MSGTRLVELAGIFLALIGLFGLVVAAAMISVALAVAVASFIALFVGVSAVYLANVSRPAEAGRT